MGQGGQVFWRQTGLIRKFRDPQFISGDNMKLRRREFLNLAAGAAALPAPRTGHRGPFQKYGKLR